MAHKVFFEEVASYHEWLLNNSFAFLFFFSSYICVHGGRKESVAKKSKGKTGHSGLPDSCGDYPFLRTAWHLLDSCGFLRNVSTLSVHLLGRRRRRKKASQVFRGYFFHRISPPAAAATFLNVVPSHAWFTLLLQLVIWTIVFMGERRKKNKKEEEKEEEEEEAFFLPFFSAALACLFASLDRAGFWNERTNENRRDGRLRKRKKGSHTNKCAVQDENTNFELVSVDQKDDL